MAGSHAAVYDFSADATTSVVVGARHGRSPAPTDRPPMPIDPLLRLAVAIHANAGAYALLLGSGVSRAAGIPTGWEVTLDLVRRLAAAAGAAAACGSDPEAWYRARFGREPNYSALLDEVAPTQAERQRLLRGYFEPPPTVSDPGEPIDAGAADGHAPDDPAFRRPTAAHRAAAALAAAGHVRLILTTNFDTLVETALAAADVPHAVLTSGHDIEGAPPLVHGGVVVVKVHGDYRDARILNTPAELEGYDPRLRAYLARVFDEFGLVVCGWSADYDVALRDLIAGAPARRYTTFWAARGAPSEAARRLIGLRAAEVVPIADADAFLTGVADRVDALRTIDAPHPLEAPVAAARLKRYLASDAGRIRAHDLTLAAADAVRTAGRDDLERLRATPAARSAVWEHLARLGARSAALVALMGTGCYWGADAHDAIWVKALGRASDLDDAILRETGAGEAAWNDLRYYPATLAFYAGGLAAAAAGRWGLVTALLTREVARYATRLPAARWLNPRASMGADVIGEAIPYLNVYATRSEHVLRVLATPLRDLYADAAAYERAFDEFEFLVALVCADHSLNAPGGRTDVPGGRYERNLGRAGSIAPERAVVESLESAGAGAPPGPWPPLAAGLFGGSRERLAGALDAVRTRRQ